MTRALGGLSPLRSSRGGHFFGANDYKNCRPTGHYILSYTDFLPLSGIGEVE